MALDPKKRQKKLLKKSAKRKEKKIQINSNKSNETSEEIANYPIYECLVPDKIFETGMGNVYFARKTPAGHVYVSGFIVETFCMGVRRALYYTYTMSDYYELVNKSKENLVVKTPSYLRKLVEGLLSMREKSVLNHIKIMNVHQKFLEILMLMNVLRILNLEVMVNQFSYVDLTNLTVTAEKYY